MARKEIPTADNEDLARNLLDESPFPMFRVYEDGHVVLPNLAAREAVGLLNKDKKKLTARPARAATHSLKTSVSEFTDFNFGDKIINLYFDPVPDKGYVNVYGRDVTQIRENMRAIFAISNEEGISTAAAADRFAERRVEEAAAAKAKA